MSNEKQAISNTYCIGLGGKNVFKGRKRRLINQDRELTKESYIRSKINYLLNILSIEASSERIFTIFDFILTKLKNKNSVKNEVSKTILRTILDFYPQRIIEFKVMKELQSEFNFLGCIYEEIKEKPNVKEILNSKYGKNQCPNVCSTDMNDFCVKYREPCYNCEEGDELDE